MCSKIEIFIFLLCAANQLTVAFPEASPGPMADPEADPVPDASPSPEPGPESDPEAQPRFVSGLNEGVIFDDDAIILVSPGQKNSENRAPRQYKGNPVKQTARAATGSSQTAKDLVSGKQNF